MNIVLLIAVAIALLAAAGKAAGLSITHPGVNHWQPEIKAAAAEFGVPAPIIAGVMWQESRGRADSIGRNEEVGLMQLKPIAVRDVEQNGYGYFNGWEMIPGENIRAGAAFLSLQYKRAGNWRDALRSYNRGFSAATADPGAGSEYAESVISKAKEFSSNDR